MTRLAEIQGHIASMSELLDIVGAMRSLAGMRVQEAQRALPGIRRYADAMAEAIGGGLLLTPSPASETPPDRRRRALVLCAAEHGFVGGFNEQLRQDGRQARQAEVTTELLDVVTGAEALEAGRDDGHRAHGSAAQRGAGAEI